MVQFYIIKSFIGRVTMIESLIQYTKSFKILFVEDNDNSREQTVKIFQNLFGIIKTASDGNIALEKFKDNKFNIIFTDINMPNLDGISFIKKVREEDEVVPIIMLSAYDDKSYMLECIDAGVDGYLIKPMQLQKLLKILQKIVTKMNVAEVQQFLFLEGNFYWNTHTKKLFRGEEIVLTSYETSFLEFLISAKGVTRTNMEIELSLFDDTTNYNDKRIRNLVSRLRKKVGYDFLESVYGEGYRVKILS